MREIRRMLVGHGSRFQRTGVKKWPIEVQDFCGSRNAPLYTYLFAVSAPTANQSSSLSHPLLTTKKKAHTPTNQLAWPQPSEALVYFSSSRSSSDSSIPRPPSNLYLLSTSNTNSYCARTYAYGFAEEPDHSRVIGC